MKVKVCGPLSKVVKTVKTAVAGTTANEVVTIGCDQVVGIPSMVAVSIIQLI